MQQPKNVVLVEPAGSLNVGNVARLCENFGVTELRLVKPRCDPNNEEARRMAVKGKRFLDKAHEYSSLLDAITDCRRVVATAGRIDHGSIPLSSPAEAINWSLETSQASPIALIFGREDRGLTNQELLLAQKVLTLNSISHYPSLNLSHAVGIVLYELQRCEEQRYTKKAKDPQNDPASPQQINDCINEAENLLLQVGFLYTHTAKARMSKIKALLQRAEIRPKEVSLIRGICHQINWAIDKQNS